MEYGEKIMKYFSCFAGIGGFELGITNAYEIMRAQNSGQVTQGTGSENGRCEQRSDISAEGLTCIGFSEIDKYAQQIYLSHFPNHQPYGDITKIDTNKLPDFDMLVGGFPCQAFSIAGKRRGFGDTRGTLFFELARILQAKQPRLFVFENVKGLLSHDSGKTFATIIATIAELGYDCQWQVLNSKNHGVPQNRERVFIVGHLRGTSRPKVFPFGESNPRNLEQIIGGGQGNRVYNTDGVSVTLASQAGGRGAKTGLYAKTIRSGGRSSPHGSKQNWDSYEHMGKIRRLTPTECERLQGFPDGWTEGVSDTQRYKCLGNAVTTNVVSDIFIQILGSDSKKKT